MHTNLINRSPLSSAILRGGNGLEMCYGTYFNLSLSKQLLACCTLGAAALAEFAEFAVHNYRQCAEADKRLDSMLLGRFPVLKETGYSSRLFSDLGLHFGMPSTPLLVAIHDINDRGASRTDIAHALSRMGL